MADSTRSATPERPSERLLILGQVGAPWGVRGWVRLNSYTEPRDALQEYEECFLRRDGHWSAAKFEKIRPQGKSLVGKLEQVDDRDAAIAWRGAEIGIPREKMPEPGDGHYYWADLEGLRVRHRDGRDLGRVEYLLATGEHDVLVAQGERETLIPFVMNKVILDVDLAEGVITVDWEWD